MMKARFLLIGLVVIFVTGVLTTQSHAKIDPASISGQWLFDEGNGDTAKDSSVNKIDGTIINAKWVDGKRKPSKALQLDGSSSYVMVHIGAPPQSISIEAWIYPTAPGGVVFAENGQQALDGGWYDSHMEVLDTGEIKVGFWTGAEQGISLGIFPLNNWYYVVMTYAKKDTSIKGYVNGELKQSGVLAKLYPGDLWYGIGGHTATNLGSGKYFKGIIDEAAVYNVTLTADEILQNYKTANAVDSSDKMATTWASIKAR
jgi:hypothetical protein